MATFRHPVTECPQCRHKLDASGDVEDQRDARPPGPGDLTICIECGVALAYEPTMHIRLATLAEVREAKAQGPEFDRVQGAVHAMRAARLTGWRPKPRGAN